MIPIRPIDAPKADELISLEAWQQLVGIVGEKHPADIADWLDQLDYEAAVAVFQQLDHHIASEVLDEVEIDTQQALFDGLSDEHLALVLSEMPMDDAAEVLEWLPTHRANHLMELMHPEEAAEAAQLLSYPEDSAGRLMRTDVAAIHADWTVAQATDYLRSRQIVANLYTLYVVDEERHLVGRVRSRSLLLSDDDTLVSEIMHGIPASVPPETDQEHVAALIAHYDVLAIPVVDEESCLLGVVTVDDLIDVVTEEATEDIHRMGGSLPLATPYFATPTFMLYRKRISWLMLLFVAGALTGLVTRAYQVVWLQFAALATFVPLLIGTGGNTGSQTTATIVRALSLQQVDNASKWRAWRKEVTVGFMLGATMAIMTLILALVWNIQIGVVACVALSLPAIIIWSTTLGTLVPIFAERFGIDPTAVSGPMITTVVDVTGLIIYYTLAGFILGVF